MIVLIFHALFTLSSQSTNQHYFFSLISSHTFPFFREFNDQKMARKQQPSTQPSKSLHKPTSNSSFPCSSRPHFRSGRISHKSAILIPTSQQSNLMKAVLLTLAVIVAVLAQNPPVWPVRFQQDFVESWSTTQYHDVGKLWYDAERVMSRLDRSNGKYDGMCNSITNATTPCTQLVREGKRYMVYPLIRLCCYCCNSAQGCGILKRTWLAGAKFAGKDELSGQIFDKFRDSEHDVDYWASTDSKQLPRKLVEGGANFKDFIMNTYSEEYIPDSVFALPSYCGDNICPATSACATP